MFGQQAVKTAGPCAFDQKVQEALNRFEIRAVS
jgi:hypothetical protein